MKAHAEKNDIDYTLLLTLLRQLDFSRVQFGKDMIEFSEGQNKEGSDSVQSAHTGTYLHMG